MNIKYTSFAIITAVIIASIALIDPWLIVDIFIGIPVQILIEAWVIITEILLTMINILATPLILLLK